MNRFLLSILSAALAVGVATAQRTPGSSTTTPTDPASPAAVPANPATTPASTPETVAPPPTQNAPQTPAQSTPPAQAQTPTANVPRIAPGSVIPVSLTKTIDAKKAKTGDEVVAKVTQDLKSTAGALIVAKDTKMMGHITVAQPRTKDQKESQVAIAFDHAVTKDGAVMTMPMSIQAIIGPQNNNENNSVQSTSSSSEPSPTPSAGGMRAGGSAPNAAPAATTSTDTSSAPQSSTAARPPINAQTQGVIGISDLTLASTGQNAAQGSVVTSDKTNVKIEGGTMMLLRVSQ